MTLKHSMSVAWRPKETGQAFAALSSRTRKVITVKYGLAAASLVLVACMAYFSFKGGNENRFDLMFGSLETTEAGPTKMLKPQLRGMDDKNQPYVITADVAYQTAEKSVRMERISADLTLADGGWLALKAQHGEVDMGAHHMTLHGEVDVFHNGGYEFRTSRVEVDISGSILHGPEPVEGQGPSGTLKARAFDAAKATGIISFHGPVNVVLYPEAKK